MWLIGGSDFVGSQLLDDLWRQFDLEWDSGLQYGYSY